MSSSKPLSLCSMLKIPGYIGICHPPKSWPLAKSATPPAPHNDCHQHHGSTPFARCQCQANGGNQWDLIRTSGERSYTNIYPRSPKTIKKVGFFTKNCFFSRNFINHSSSFGDEVYQLLQSDLLIPQLEVTFSTPKKGSRMGSNYVYIYICVCNYM